jgi:hypothetical protein
MRNKMSKLHSVARDREFFGGSDDIAIAPPISFEFEDKHDLLRVCLTLNPELRTPNGERSTGKILG